MYKKPKIIRDHIGPWCSWRRPLGDGCKALAQPVGGRLEQETAENYALRNNLKGQGHEILTVAWLIHPGQERGRQLF
jgi:hypothetical protein